jgi:transcriptional regulator NrdR family protein
MLFMSLVRALGHRSDSLEAAGHIADTVTARLLKSHPGASIEVIAIRSMAYTTLLSFDEVAAISYAAYHKA